jgi:hypothetical protein
MVRVEPRSTFVGGFAYGILAVSDFCMIRSFYNFGFVAIPWPAQLER